MCTNAGDSGAQTYNVSELTQVRENYSQLQTAIRTVREQGASKVEYIGIDGKTVNRYWNGATFTDRRSSLYESQDPKYKRNGIYKAKSKPPKSWQN